MTEQFTKVSVLSIEDAQAIQSNPNPNPNPNSNFLSGLFEHLDDLKQGDKVKIVGKDKLKGHIGTIDRIYTSQHNEHIFSIQLHTTGENVDRTKNNIKHHH